MRKVAIGQAGGPTSVINTTLVGLVKELMDHFSLTFIRNGYEGLVCQHVIEGDDAFLHWIFQQEHTPGACLGSGRYPMTAQEIESIVKYLKEESIDALIFIGGNGTMEALHKINLEAIRQGYELQVIGLPKTVDNDINFTDHAPGFGSAARYVAHATRDLAFDLRSMKNFEQVRVIETMGRNAGWLAAASGYFKRDDSEGPHFIALPERRLNKGALLNTVESSISRHGYAVVVVSEGVLWNEKHQISIDIINNRAVLGGISHEIEKYISKQLNLNVRSEILGMHQRCSSGFVSTVDKNEAYLVGETGGRWLREEQSGVMVSIQRAKKENYEINMKQVDLKDVADSGERLMPNHFIDFPAKYHEWLKPIIEEETANSLICEKDMIYKKVNFK